MFKVRNKETGELFTVFHVEYEYSLYFLIYKDGGWYMDQARKYEPVEEGSE